MDEASSRFVDRLVTQKIVSEKLALVRHAPECPLENLLEEPFPDTKSLLARTFMHEEIAPHCYRIESVVDSDFVENRQILVQGFPTATPKGIIVLCHGLFEDNRGIYGFLISELNRLGYAVYLTTLPFHHERKPRESAFSGEFFFSAALGRTKRAFRQATVELLQIYGWLKRRHGLPAYMMGFSMGASIALAAAQNCTHLDGLCLLNPAALLCEVIWTSPLCTTIKDDLLAAGLEPVTVNRVLESFDPTVQSVGSLSTKHCLLLFGLYDLVTQPHQYDELVRRFSLEKIRKYKAGHLNILRVPRLGEDIVTFFNACTAEKADASLGDDAHRNADRLRLERPTPRAQTRGTTH